MTGRVLIGKVKNKHQLTLQKTVNLYFLLISIIIYH